jgi:hypothetical protein
MTSGLIFYSRILPRIASNGHYAAGMEVGVKIDWVASDLIYLRTRSALNSRRVTFVIVAVDIEPTR